MLRRLFAVFVLITVAGAVATAQTTTASLLGVVRDKSGAAIPEAQVTVRNVLTSFKRTTVSGESGDYLITNLPVGEYMVVAEKPGFARFVQKGLTLDIDQNARVDMILSVGDVAESVTVTAQSTGVETRSTSDGGRNTQNEFRFDGISHKNLTQNTGLNFPSPDALQEFRIMTSNYSAEYGRNSGAVVAAVTRAGTNQFHGSFWEFLRNTHLNARNFFSVSKPDLKQNQYGLAAGGPVIRNRLFFFGCYQGTKIRESQLLATALPPTAAERARDFSVSPKRPKIYGLK